MTNVRLPIRLRTTGNLSAVKLQDRAGSSLRDPTSTLMTIPPDVVVEVEGVVSSSGLVTVLWNGNAFSVLDEDLRERGEVVASAVPGGA